jgi:hypothetical protein
MTSSTRTILTIGAVLSSSIAGYACEKTPVEAHNDGVAAQKEADKTTVEAIKQAGEKIEEANHDVAAATDEARKTAAEAQAKANEKIRDANRIVVGERNDARSWGQKEIDSVDGLIENAIAKAQTGTPKAKEQFNTAITGVKQQRDVLNTELAALEAPAGDKLDKSKAQFTERVDRIKLELKSIAKAN